MSALFVTHPACERHVTGPTHPERPQRLQAVRRAVEASGLEGALVWDEQPPEVDPDLLERVHRRAYIETVEALARAGGGWLNTDTAVGPESARAARLAAGAAQRATEVLLAGGARRAFVAVRPPGHHAEPGRGMGFCLFNNAAVAAAAARRAGRERVLIVDWDVHHGNGTQAVFWRDPSVLVVSIHQEYWYPGTGAVEELGEGPGEGWTVNVPLPAETGDGGYADVFTEVVLPLAYAARPQFIVVSAGYDAHFADPLGGMVMSATGFRQLARLMDEVARTLDVPLLAVLEGGYHLDALATSVVATLEALAGRPTDPAAWREPAPAGLGARRPGRETPPSAIATRLRTVRRLLSTYWRL